MKPCINLVVLDEQELLNLAQSTIEGEITIDYALSPKYIAQVEALSKKDKYQLLAEIFQRLARAN